MSITSTRLRPHPSKRFAPDEHVFDLKVAAAELKREPSGQHGHKQIALFKHGPATLALFVFDPGARLEDHVIDGPVIIQTLTGHLSVTTGERSYALPAGALLRLAPGVPHDVQASEASQMLLTVCVEGDSSHG